MQHGETLPLAAQCVVLGGQEEKKEEKGKGEGGRRMEGSRVLV